MSTDFPRESQPTGPEEQPAPAGPDQDPSADRPRYGEHGYTQRGGRVGPGYGEPGYVERSGNGGPGYGQPGYLREPRTDLPGYGRPGYGSVNPSQGPGADLERQEQDRLSGRAVLALGSLLCGVVAVPFAALGDAALLGVLLAAVGAGLGVLSFRRGAVSGRPFPGAGPAVAGIAVCTLVAIWLFVVAIG